MLFEATRNLATAIIGHSHAAEAGASFDYSPESGAARIQS
jgi:hypothetical protein